MQLVEPGRHWQQLDRSDAQALQMRNRGRLGKAGNRASKFAGDAGMLLAVAAHMHLIEHGFAPGASGRGQAVGQTDLTGHPALRHEGRAVAMVEGMAALGMIGLKPKHRVMPLEAADQLSGIRVEQQLVGIEAMPVIRGIRAVGAKAIDHPGLRFRHESVKDIAGAAWQVKARDFLLAGGIEQTQLDALGVVRPDRDIDAIALDMSAEFFGAADFHRCHRAAFSTRAASGGRRRLTEAGQ